MSDQEDKDRVIEELRSDKEVLRRGLEDKDRAARLEELRFAKKQQWYIATSALTLLAAIFGIAHVIKPTTLDEKKVGTVFVVLIVWFACEFLRQLQGHLNNTRLLLDPKDRTPWLRGVDILAVLMGTIIASGLVVLYYLWFAQAERLTLQAPAAAPMSSQAPAAAPPDRWR
jgi:hypothetical protein